MLKHFNCLILCAIALSIAFSCEKGVPAYKDSKVPPEKRADDLLSRMTLEEKLGQLICPLGWPMYEKVDIAAQGNLYNAGGETIALTHNKEGSTASTGEGSTTNNKECSSIVRSENPDKPEPGEDVVISDRYREFIDRQHGGMLWATFRADPWTRKTLETGLNPTLAARAYNALQHYAIDSTRLGIPVMLAEEAPHGHMAIGTTVFPTSIGLSSTWDTALVQEVGDVIGEELRAQGAGIGYGPVIDLAREPRWSRVEETYGEDVFLTSQMASAMVSGTSGRGIISTLKHFVAYGIPEGGHNGSPSHVGPRDLEENMLPAFKAAIDAGALSVMTSYNTIDGVPSTCNGQLLDGVLRKRWNFSGFVVSDLESIDGLCGSHGVAKDRREAAELAICAGVDVDLGANCYPLLKESVESGRVPVKVIDSAVRRVLIRKFESGLFDNPYIDEDSAAEKVRTQRGKEVAARAARESVTLLKNNGILPLKGGRIALVGPNADNVYNQLGDYTAPQDPSGIVTMLKGLRNAGAEVIYAKGCAVRDYDASGFGAAVSAARKADVVVAVVGGSSARDFRTSYEETGAAMVQKQSVSDMEAGEGFDRSTLDLLGMQMELLKALKATGKPLVAVYIEGRPLSKNWAADNADAIITLWYPGQEGGNALADVLLGKYNPAGRLPISVPRNTGQLPVYYNRRVPAAHDYVEGPESPLYAFGYGLSYTSFEYSGMTVEFPDRVGNDGMGRNGRPMVTVSLDVKNTGPMDGDEVVQLYIRDLVASTARPRKQLCAFTRVNIPKGETAHVVFNLDSRAFSLVNPDMRHVIEPGDFELQAGASSDDIRLTQTVSL